MILEKSSGLSIYRNLLTVSLYSSNPGEQNKYLEVGDGWHNDEIRARIIFDGAEKKSRAKRLAQTRGSLERNLAVIGRFVEPWHQGSTGNKQQRREKALAPAFNSPCSRPALS